MVNQKLEYCVNSDLSLFQTWYEQDFSKTDLKRNNGKMKYEWINDHNPELTV